MRNGRERLAEKGAAIGEGSAVDDGVVVRRSMGISGVVVTAENVRELAGRLSREAAAEAHNGSERRLSFTLTAADGTQYDTKEVSFLDKGGVLDTRSIISIEMSLGSWLDDTRLSISLAHGEGARASDNSAEVSGKDETWVNGSIQWVQDCVSNWKKQVMWPPRHPVLVWLGSMIILAAGWFLALRAVAIGTDTSEPVTEVLALVFGLALIGMGYGAFLLVYWLRGLYAKVEFAMGPERQQVEKGKRGRLYGVVALVFAPLGVTLLWEGLRVLVNALS